MDASKDGIGWGKFFRIKVELMLNRALTRRRTPSVNGEKAWEKAWIPIK